MYFVSRVHPFDVSRPTDSFVAFVQELLEMERQKMLENANIQKLDAIIRGGAKTVPVEVLQLFNVTDEAALKRLQNAATMQVIQGTAGRWANANGDKKQRD